MLTSTIQRKDFQVKIGNDTVLHPIIAQH